MHDLHNHCRTARALDPADFTTTAGRTGVVIDRQGWGGVEFIIAYGDTGASTSIIPVVIKEGDATGSLASVADADLLGTEAAAGIVAGARTSGVGKNVTKRVGYRGNKRYVQANFGTVSAATASGTKLAGIVALLHSPSLSPTTNP